MSGGNISATSSINDQTTNLTLARALRIEDMFPLGFLFWAFLGVENPLENKEFSHIRS